MRLDVFTIEPDGSGLASVTDGASGLPDVSIGQPEWHPDGDHIVIQVESENSAGRSPEHVSFGLNNDLWMIKKDGTGAEKIWDTPLNHAALHPHFNSGGTVLIFAERIATGVVVTSPLLTPGGENHWAGWQIHVADFDIAQTGTARLSNHRVLFGAGLPQNRGFFETHGFADSDQRIVFSGTLGGANFVDDCFAVLLNGAGIETIVSSPTTWDEHADYSPTSDTIFAFNSSRSDPNWTAGMSTPAELTLESFLDEAGVVHQLTTFNADFPGQQYVTSDFAWDASGTRIVLQAALFSGGSPQIWILTLSGIPVPVPALPPYAFALLGAALCVVAVRVSRSTWNS